MGFCLAAMTIVVLALPARVDAQFKNGNHTVLLRSAGADDDTTSGVLEPAYDGSYPAWSPDGSKIAFTSTRDGNSEIYIVDADGRNLKRLTNHPAVDQLPRWSPDGQTLVFESNRDGNTEIYRIGREAGEPQRLTDSPYADRFPVWSPDGKRVAFYRDIARNWEVFVMKSDGSDQRNLTNHRERDGVPFWHPDGQRIGFHSTRDGRFQLYTMNVDGSEQRNLSNNKFHEDLASWSHDGSRVVFFSNQVEPDNAEAQEIFVRDLESGATIQLSSDDTVGAVGEFAPPSWAPDGKSILFYAKGKGGTFWRIYSIGVDGKNLEQLTFVKKR